MPAGAPKKHPQLVKVPVSFKLSNWLLTWMRAYSDEQGISMATMIEEALSEKHGVTPPKIKPKKQGEKHGQKSIHSR